MRVVRPTRFERDRHDQFVMFFRDAREDCTSYGPEHGPTSPLVSIEVARDQDGIVCNPFDMDEVGSLITTESGSSYGAILDRLQINTVNRLVKLCDAPRWRLPFRSRTVLKTKLGEDSPVLPPALDASESPATGSRVADDSAPAAHPYSAPPPLPCPPEEPGELIRFSCPACGRVMKATARASGKAGKCPKCGHQVTVPGYSPSPSPVIDVEPVPYLPVVVYDPYREFPAPLLPRILAVLSLILGFIALPLSIAMNNYWAGILSAGLGVIFGAYALKRAVGIRGAGAGKALLGFIACTIVLVCGVQLGGGPKALYRQALERFAQNKGTAPQPSVLNTDSESAPRPNDVKDTEQQVAPKTQQKIADADVAEQRVAPKTQPKIADADVARLAAILQRKGEEEERVQAANQLARIGDKARPAIRAICEAALDPSKTVREACLAALEKIHPPLGKAIITLLVDQDGDEHIRAITALGNMGAEAKGALPVLIAYISTKEAKAGSYRWDTHIAITFNVLLKIAPDDPDTINVLRKFATEPNEYLRGLRWQAITALGQIGKNHSRLRGEIMPVLQGGLTDEQTCLVSLQALEGFGDDAKPAIPAIKKLKFNQNTTIRNAANALLEKLE